MWKKLLLVLAVVLAVAVAAGGGVFLWWRSEGRPMRSGEARLPGLEGVADVRFDRWGVPYVLAQSSDDLFAAQGWLHANDRLVQMELGRRFTAGRLAELVGEPAVEVDRWSRIRRYPHTAERLWDHAGPATREALAAYARGVNAWLAAREGDLPPELVLLGTEPEPWRPVDSLGFVVLMADDLSFWQGRPEEERFRWLGAFGADTLRDLMDDPLLHVPEEIERLAASLETPPPAAPAAPPADAAPGSNNWAVGPALSASGAPIVANDPHLGLGLPGVWYQVLLRSPGYRVSGLSLPGVPGVVIGRNRHLAWALTNTMLDDHDLFFEQLDETGTRVRRGGEWRPVEVARETIRVEGGGEVVVELASTDRGPLLPADPERRLPARSLAWTLYQPADPLAAFFHLGRARSLSEALAGLDGYTGPAQNLLVADGRGALGYTVLGRVPARRLGDGRLPAPGWSEAYGWRGLRPFDTNPRVVRRPSGETGASGVLVTANHDVLPPGYELPFAADFMPPFRAQRIVQRLAERPAGDGELWTPEAMAQLQTDVVSLYDQRLVAALERRLRGPDGLTGDAAAVVEELARWDRRGHMSGTTAALASRAAHELMLAVFEDEARHHGVPFPGSRERLLRLLEGDLDPAFFDDVTTAARETPRQVIERALAAAHAARGPRYEEIHHLHLRHPLGGVPLLGRLLNRGPWPVPGSGDTINALAGRWRPDGERMSVVFGPSVRWVVDLGAPDAGRAVLPGGQSGHPFDPHYDDQLELYLAGETRPVPWTREAIEAATVSRLRLVP